MPHCAVCSGLVTEEVEQPASFVADLIRSKRVGQDKAVMNAPNDVALGRGLLDLEPLGPAPVEASFHFHMLTVFQQDGVVVVVAHNLVSLDTPTGNCKEWSGR